MKPLKPDTTSTHLPTLPRTLNKREANITPKVLKCLATLLPGSWAVEIKATSGKSIPLSAVQPHQLLALKQVKTQGVVHKISDEARRKQPFDAFKVKGDAYVVACFTSDGICLVIDANLWNGARVDMASGYAYRVPL